MQLNLKLVATKASLEKVTEQQTQTGAKLLKTSSDLEAVSHSRNKMKIELSQNNNLLKLKDSECNRLLKENSQSIKYREVLQKKMMNLESVKGDLIQEVLKFK